MISAATRWVRIWCATKGKVTLVLSLFPRRPIGGQAAVLPDQNPPLRFPCRGGSMPFRRRPEGHSARGNTMNRVFVALALAAGVVATNAKAQDIPTIRVGWTIPAEESKYWLMRRPQEFPDLGKKYKIEWSQFQGTSVMSQALIAGALDCATQGILPIAQ